MAALSYSGAAQPRFILMVGNASEQSLADSIDSLLALDELKLSEFKLVLWAEASQADLCCGFICRRWGALQSALSVVSDLGELAPCWDNNAVFLYREGERLHPKLLMVLDNWPLQDASLAYTDCDHLGDNGLRSTPQFFPDWNPDLQLTIGYVATGVWIKSFSLIRYEAQQPYANFIRHWLMNTALDDRQHSVEHISFSLLHKRQSEVDLLQALPKSLANRLSTQAQFVQRNPNCLQFDWQLPSKPLVSLIIPTRNAWQLVKSCIDSILKLSSYQYFEILLVDNNSDEVESLTYFKQISEHPKVRLLKYPGAFNYSAINNYAARQCRGEIIGLVNNDIEVISEHWLASMVAQVMRPEIGCVGAKLLYSDKSVQHAGVIMGYGGGAGHAHKFFAADAPGYMQRLVASHNVSAVTAACLLVKRADFEKVGGLNEQDLKVAFNDVDFCLKVRELGRRNLFCAEALLFHHESVSRGAEDTPEKMQRFESEVAYLKRTWGAVIANDPAYNRHLTLKQENFLVADSHEYRPYFGCQG
ncbi:glycosyltransferase family 2 protein [Bowmanella yangjiangensis]|uniref:Glycosyltransferase family 2 protein n=1 Tax=Bowmanella yangjiangensis TaxID=2811230 RepID=A0ABS3CWD2_9ALTE|nr:glycosyltransferase family 2 protein [Bowmanella yangjiangensis]MBN7820456.1 glycosyltransferase family 2 protein [Bowmanella yangjiangensis]